MHELTDKIIEYLFSTKYLSGGVYSDLSKYSINDIIENWIKEKAVEIDNLIPMMEMNKRAMPYPNVPKILGIKEESLEGKLKYLIPDGKQNEVIAIFKQHYKDHPEQLKD